MNLRLAIALTSLTLVACNQSPASNDDSGQGGPPDGTIGSTSNDTGKPIGREGEFCGGIAAFECEAGLTCQYDGTYPDAGGTCVKE